MIYINDISKIMDLVLFADDTKLFLRDTCLDSLDLNVNAKLDKVTKWIKIN
jgi:hypothetical protein